MAQKYCKSVLGKDSVIAEIVRLMFVDDNLIYPCCNLNIMEITKDGNLKIEGWIANYDPGPFQNGWSGRPGPFIYCVYEKFISPKLNTNSESFKSKLIDLGLIV